MVRARTAADQGDTLVELLIAVTIGAVAVASVVGGITFLNTGNAVHADQASVETVLRTVADYMAQPSGVTYVACNNSPLSAYDTAIQSAGAPAGYTADVTNVEFWDGTTGGGSFLSSCPAGGDRNLERLTVQVTLTQPGVDTTQSVMILKRPV